MSRQPKIPEHKIIKGIEVHCNDDKFNPKKLKKFNEIVVETEYGIPDAICDMFRGYFGSIENRTYRKIITKAYEEGAKAVDIVKYSYYAEGCAWETWCGFRLRAKLYQ